MALGDYNKAIVSGIVALGATLQVAQVQGGITSTEWISAFVGALITGVLTWSVSNTGTFAWLDNQIKTVTTAQQKIQPPDSSI